MVKSIDGINTEAKASEYQSKLDEARRSVEVVANYLRAMNPNKVLRELRAVKVRRRYGNAVTMSGFFDWDHTIDMARTAIRLTNFGFDGTPAPAVYWTINRISPDLQARCSNRVDIAQTGTTTADTDVTGLEWFFIDVDPKRLAGISATDEEKAASHAVHVAVKDYFTSMGWPSPVEVDSGNGCHSYYHINLTPNDSQLIKVLLNGIANQFNTPQATVDTGVFNPARITKLVGTFARKGDAIHGRPHRLATLIGAIPDPPVIVTREQIQAAIEDLSRKQNTSKLPFKVASQQPLDYQTPNDFTDTIDRASKFLKRIPGAVSGQRGHDATIIVAGHLVRGFGLPVEVALPLLAEWNEKCEPQWTDGELRHKLNDATKHVGRFGYLLQDDRPQNHQFVDGLNVGCDLDNSGLLGSKGSQPTPLQMLDAQLSKIRDQIANGKSCNIADALMAAQLQFTSHVIDLRIQTLNELKRQYTSLRLPIIEGLLRRGEIMNIIAAPKTGKSWLVMMLALSVAAGIKWLDKYVTTRGKVLLIDNELHGETLSERLPRVASAMGLEPSQYEELIHVIHMRGQLMDLNELCEQLRRIEPGTYDLIIFDAFYRFIPQDVDENSNAQITQLYNTVDKVAGIIGSAFAVVHHTSKGSQANKGISDVGAGAGSQSRAPDTHLVLREHERSGAVVVEAVVRSWSPVDASVIRWEYPIWVPDDTLDPRDLRKPGKKSETANRNPSNADPALSMKTRANRIKVLEFLEDLFPNGETKNGLEIALKMSARTFTPLQEDLLSGGLIETCKVRKRNGEHSGFRITVNGSEELRQLRQTQELSDCQTPTTPTDKHPLKGGALSESELSDPSGSDFSEATFIALP